VTAAGSDAPVGPAPTRWAPTPTAPTPPPTVPSRLPVTPVRPPTPPAGPVLTIPAPPPPAATTPHRVVVFQKPAGTEGTAPTPQKKIDPPAPAPTTPQPVVPQPKPTEPSIDLTAEFRPYTILSRERVFQLTSDEDLRRRVTRELYEEEVERQKANPDPNRKVTEQNYRPPVIPPIGKGVAYQTKVVRYGYPAMQSLIEPTYVVHRRLLFEEKNADRFGWDAGIVQPFIRTAYFYKDVLLWPAHLASNPFERYDTSAGKCLPGDPVPYFLYPPEIDLFGGSVGAAAIVGTVFLFP
jgi:hypothetical protein